MPPFPRCMVPGLVLTLALAVPTATVGAQDGAAPAPAKPAAQLQIGVVDFIKLVEAYPRYLNEMKLIKAKSEDRQNLLKEESNKLKQLDAERETLLPDSTARRQKDLEFELAKLRFKGLADITGADLQDQHDRLIVECFKDAEKCIAKVAQERGIALVLRLHPDLRTDSLVDQRRICEQRQVWYAADEVDLTADVIKLMRTYVPPAAPEKQDAPAPVDAGKK